MSNSLKAAVLAAVEYMSARGQVLPAPLLYELRALGIRQRDAKEKRLMELFRKIFERQRAIAEAALSKAGKALDDYGLTDDEATELYILLTDTNRLGIDDFAASIDLAFDYTGRAKASAWAREYGGALIKNIAEHTRKVVGDAVGYFIDTEGATLGDAIDRLGAAFDEARAMTIATTEITQAYAAGQEEAADELYEAYPELNIVKTWYTVSDEITCPICGPLHGMTIERNEPYGYDVFDNELMSPPAHPNCRCDITYEVA